MTIETIGSYRVTSSLGAGALGEVLVGEHIRTGQRVAIKVLSVELARIPGALDRLFTELRATSLVSKPGIVTIIDCDRLPDGRGYIIREYLEGETLRDFLNRVVSLSADLDTAREIVTQLADTLGAAHEMGILHLDLKPENIFLAQAASGESPIQAKLLDFGMANIAQRGTRKTAIAAGLTTGTVQYMAPEQCSGGEPDRRADVYGLGCVLFELVSGRPPFVRDSFTQLLMAHMKESPPALRSFDPSLPRELDELVSAMLAKNPAERPASMRDVVTAISLISNQSVAGAGSSQTMVLPAADSAPEVLHRSAASMAPVRARLDGSATPVRTSREGQAPQAGSGQPVRPSRQPSQPGLAVPTSTPMSAANSTPIPPAPSWSSVGGTRILCADEQESSRQPSSRKDHDRAAARSSGPGRGRTRGREISSRGRTGQPGRVRPERIWNRTWFVLAFAGVCLAIFAAVLYQAVKSGRLSPGAPPAAPPTSMELRSGGPSQPPKS